MEASVLSAVDPGARRMSVAFLRLMAALFGGCESHQGLMCHVGLATARAAWNTNGGENTLRRKQWPIAARIDAGNRPA
jgi:hypothetical protein